MQDALFAGVVALGEAERMCRDSLIEFITDRAKAFGWPENGAPLVDIELPCGERLVIQSEDDVPYKSVPCPCGDPNHWLVKYEIVDHRVASN